MGNSAFNHREWAERGLKDFSDFADCVSYINQKEYGDGQLEGDWFFADDDTQTVYFGTFGNDNSLGASSYTFADQYQTQEEYLAEVARLEAMPEYLETEEEETIGEHGECIDCGLQFERSMNDGEECDSCGHIVGEEF